MKITAVLIVFTAFVIPGMAQYSPDKASDISALSNQFADNLKVLSHDSLEGRNTLSEGIRKAERIILQQITESGAKPFEAYGSYLQKVPLAVTTPPGSIQVIADDHQIADSQNSVMITGENGNYAAHSEFVESLLDTDIAALQLQGKIVVTTMGGQGNSPGAWLSSGKAKRIAAMQAGAVALVELFEPGKFPWQMINGYLNRPGMKLDADQASIPHLWLKLDESLSLGALKSGKEMLQLIIEGHSKVSGVDHNIAAFLPGTDPDLADEWVFFTAHYDHVGIGQPDATGDSIYNGARDNAIGIATLLGLTAHFKKHPSPRPVAFIFFTAEEKGLLGSEYFAANLPVPARNIRFVFNCDNGGYTDTDIITVMGLHKMTGFEAIDTWIEDTGISHYEPVDLAKRLFYQSDNIHFAQMGIPAPTVGMGVRAFDERISKYYHKPGDHFESFDSEYMSRYWRAVASLADKLVHLPELPFWRDNETFYEKGKTLYGTE